MSLWCFGFLCASPTTLSSLPVSFSSEVPLTLQGFTNVVRHQCLYQTFSPTPSFIHLQRGKWVQLLVPTLLEHFSHQIPGDTCRNCSKTKGTVTPTPLLNPSGLQLPYPRNGDNNSTDFTGPLSGLNELIHGNVRVLPGILSVLNKC